MVPPITPPTDSLYKFLAITGLVLIVVTLIVDTQEVNEVNSLRDAWLTQVAALKSDLSAAIESGPPAASKTATATDPTAGRFVEMAQHTKNVDTFYQKYDLAKDALAARQKARLGYVVFSGLLALFGFALWYVKVQRPQDEMLLMQLEKAKLEAKPQKPNPLRKFRGYPS